MRLRRESFDPVMRVRTVGPLISMGPKSQLELQPTGSCLSSDKTQHLKILFPLAGGKRGEVLFSRLAAKPDHAYIVTRDLDEIGVREVKVVAGDTAREVV